MEEIFIRDDMIRLGQFLKLANLVEDGAQAREVIQHGLVKVNGDIEEARGKQLHPRRYRDVQRRDREGCARGLTRPLIPLEIGLCGKARRQCSSRSSPH